MFKAVLRARLMTAFVGRNTKRSAKARVLLYGILYIYVFIALFSMLYLPCREMLPGLLAADALWFLYAVSGIGAFAFSVFFDAPMAQSQLFEAKDNDLLGAMPIPHWMILASRMLLLYVFSFFFSAAMFSAPFAAIVSAVGLNGRSVLAFLLMLLLAPLPALALSSFLGWGLAWLKSRFPGAKYISTVFLVLLVCAYMLLVGRMGNLFTVLAEHSAVYAQNLSRVFPPMAWFARGMAGEFRMILVFALLSAALLIPVCRRLSRGFLGAAAPAACRTGKKTKKEAPVRTPFRALVLRELRHFASSSSVMLNVGLGLIMEILAAGLLFFKRAAILDAIGGIFTPEQMAVACAAGLILLAGTITYAAASVSLERNTLWVVRSMPVTTGKVLLSKAAAQFVLSIPSALLSAFFLIAACGAWNGTGVLLIAASAVITVFASLFGVWWNLVFPRLDFLNDVAAVKTGLGVLFYMLSLWLVGIVIGVGYIAVMELFPPAAFLSALMLLLALLSLLLLRFLSHRGARKFERL